MSNLEPTSDRPFNQPSVRFSLDSLSINSPQLSELLGFLEQQVQEGVVAWFEQASGRLHDTQSGFISASQREVGLLVRDDEPTLLFVVPDEDFSPFRFAQQAQQLRRQGVRAPNVVLIDGRFEENNTYFLPADEGGVLFVERGYLVSAEGKIRYASFRMPLPVAAVSCPSSRYTSLQGFFDQSGIDSFARWSDNALCSSAELLGRTPQGIRTPRGVVVTSNSITSRGLQLFLQTASEPDFRIARGESPFNYDHDYSIPKGSDSQVVYSALESFLLDPFVERAVLYQTSVPSRALTLRSEGVTSTDWYIQTLTSGTLEVSEQLILRSGSSRPHVIPFDEVSQNFTAADVSWLEDARQIIIQKAAVLGSSVSSLCVTSYWVLDRRGPVLTGLSAGYRDFFKYREEANVSQNEVIAQLLQRLTLAAPQRLESQDNLVTLREIQNPFRLGEVVTSASGPTTGEEPKIIEDESGTIIQIPLELLRGLLDLTREVTPQEIQDRAYFSDIVALAEACPNEIAVPLLYNLGRDLYERGESGTSEIQRYALTSALALADGPLSLALAKSTLEIADDYRDPLLRERVMQEIQAKTQRGDLVLPPTATIIECIQAYSAGELPRLPDASDLMD